MDTFLVNSAQGAGGAIANATPLSKVLLNVLNFLLSIVGIVAIIGIVMSGFWYFFAAGDEHRIETAKRTLWYSVIGLVVALGAWVIVSQISAMVSS